MRSSLRKNLRYFRLLPNLAQRKLIYLANYRPSFMPYDAMVTQLEIFKRKSEMASRSGRSRGRSIPLEEVTRMIEKQETDAGGLSSDEESDLDQQLYDIDEDRR